MALVVVIESPKTIPVSSYQFYRGQEIWVTGKETILPGINAPGFPVWVDIVGESGVVPLSGQTQTDFLGNFALPFTLPYEDSKLRITVTAARITANDVVIINASVGSSIPDNPPIPPEPAPLIPSITPSWTAAMKWLPWIAIGFGMIYLISVLPKGKLLTK